MRPKNRVFCRIANKPKILFDSKEKAERFIKYNSGDMLNKKGYCPTRAYKCLVCGGWHVTSKDSNESYRSKDEMLVNFFGNKTEEEDEDYERKMNEFHDKVLSILEKARMDVEFGMFDIAEESIVRAARYLDSRPNIPNRDVILESMKRIIRITESSISRSYYISIPVFEDIILCKEEVYRIYNECLIGSDSESVECTIVRLNEMEICFDIEALSKRDHEIRCLINQLPNKMRESRRKGGSSTRSLCFVSGGDKWCESNIYADMILSLGIAIGALSYGEFNNGIVLIKDIKTLRTWDSKK